MILQMIKKTKDEYFLAVYLSTGATATTSSSSGSRWSRRSGGSRKGRSGSKAVTFYFECAHRNFRLYRGSTINFTFHLKGQCTV